MCSGKMHQQDQGQEHRYTCVNTTVRELNGPYRPIFTIPNTEDEGARNNESKEQVREAMATSSPRYKVQLGGVWVTSPYGRESWNEILEEFTTAWRGGGAASGIS